MGPKPSMSAVPLPPNGREDDPPSCPYELQERGRAWWAWAWATPQATQWDDGVLFTVARRARLEDDLDAMKLATDEVDLADLLAEFDMEALRRIQWALDALHRSASGKLAVEKEMRELENRLGLNPQAMVTLKWTIGEPAKETDDLDDLSARRAARIAGGSAT
jgi:hypothetical protein